MRALILLIVFFSVSVFAQVAVPAAPAPAVASGILAWLQANGSMVFACLFGISEALAVIPGIASNSIFQLIYNTLKALKPKSS